MKQIKNFHPQIMKIDSFGNIDWVRIFESNSKEYHQFRTSITKNGGLVLVGSSIANSPLEVNLMHLLHD